MSDRVFTIRKNLALIFLATALAFLPFSKLICHVSIALYIALWVTEGNWTEKLNTFKSSWLLQFLMAWLALMVAGILLTQNNSVGIFELEKKVFLFLLPVCVATSSVKFSKQQIRLLFYGFSWVCFGLVIFCIVNAWIQWNSFDNSSLTFERIDFLNSSNYFESHPEVSRSWVFFTYIGLANGIHIHPSYFSLYLAFCIVFLLTERSQQQAFRYQHTVNVVLVGILIIALVLLSSRIVVLTMAMLFAGMVVYEFRFHRSRKQGVLISILLLGFIIGVLLNPISRHRNWKELAGMSYSVAEQTHYRTSSEIRASLWWLGWKSFQSVNPIWGAGTGEVERIMKEQSFRYKITNVLGTYDPHNEFLYILIGNGFLGFSLLAAILINGFFYAVREKQILLFAFLVLFTLLCVTESALELQKGIVFFSLIFSLLAFRRLSTEVVQPTSPTFASARS